MTLWSKTGTASTFKAVVFPVAFIGNYGENFSANLNATIRLMESYLILGDDLKVQVAETLIANEYNSDIVVVMGYLKAAMELIA